MVMVMVMEIMVIQLSPQSTFIRRNIQRIGLRAVEVEVGDKEGGKTTTAGTNVVMADIMPLTGITKEEARNVKYAITTGKPRINSPKSTTISIPITQAVVRSEIKRRIEVTEKEKEKEKE
jgi:hypothetical protein